MARKEPSWLGMALTPSRKPSGNPQQPRTPRGGRAGNAQSCTTEDGSRESPEGGALSQNMRNLQAGTRLTSSRGEQKTRGTQRATYLKRWAPEGVFSKAQSDKSQKSALNTCGDHGEPLKQEESRGSAPPPALWVFGPQIKGPLVCSGEKLLSSQAGPLLLETWPASGKGYSFETRAALSALCGPAEKGATPTGKNEKAALHKGESLFLQEQERLYPAGVDTGVQTACNSLTSAPGNGRARREWLPGGGPAHGQGKERLYCLLSPQLCSCGYPWKGPHCILAPTVRIKRQPWPQSKAATNRDVPGQAFSQI